MLGCRGAYRVEGQRLPEHLSKVHQPLHLDHACGRLALGGSRNQHFGTRLVALPHLVEREDHGEDDECGKQLQPLALVDLVRVGQRAAEWLRDECKESGPHPKQEEQIIATGQAHGVPGMDN